MIKIKVLENIKQIKNNNINIKEARNKDTLLWPMADDVIGAPGNRVLLAGNMRAGWFGEIPSSDFITGDELARMVEITAGKSQYSDESWLKFAYIGNVFLVAKKPIRYSISWDQINQANCVYGDKVISIKGKRYKIMLLRGVGENVQADSKVLNENNFQDKACIYSMWNKLILPLFKDETSYTWGTNYTDADLITHFRNGNGAASWCQEKVQNEYYRLVRGSNKASYSGAFSFTNSSYGFGWRPCLQLIG